MVKYLLIESRDPFGSTDSREFGVLAGDLVGAGHEVTVFLVQNAVLAARLGVKTDSLAEIARKGVRLLADDFSLRERSIAVDRLAPGIKPADIGAVIDALAEGTKTIWH